MKQAASFIISLALILVLGFYSVDIADMLFNSGETKKKSVIRENSSNAVYITAGDEYDFPDPMSIVSNTDSPYGDEYYAAKYILSAYIISSSAYDTSVLYCFDPDNDKLIDSIRVSNNGYVYVKHFEYTNQFGRKRYVDCIMELESLRIVYLRFYTENDTPASNNEADSSLRKFSTESDEFYKEINSGNYDFGEKSVDVFNGIIENYTSWNESLLCDVSDKFTLINVNIVAGEMAGVYAGNSVNRFWTANLCSSFLPFRDRYVDIFYEMSLYIFNGLSSYGYSSSPSYNIIGGTIYQSVNIGSSRLITYYSISDKCFEGFYAPPAK